MKVAIVADWLTNMGGAERVVYELHKMYPNAPIYTSSFNAQKMPLFKDADIRTSFIQKLPFGKKHQLWPVARRLYFGRLKLAGYDLVISSSGAEAKAVRAPDGIHINYCHSPTHYYWVRPDEYRVAKSAGSKVFRLGLKILTPWMKKWDYKVAQRPDFMICNSKNTQDKIKKFYDRESSVIYPPVDTKRFSDFNFTDRQGFVVTGRQVHYKRQDIVVAAFKDLELPLMVIGRGPENERLRAISSDSRNITFHTDLSDKQLAVEVASAKGFIFPGVEDFGIVAAEAISAGTPVIAIKDGGALDIINQENGVFFNKQTKDSLIEAIQSFQKNTYDSKRVKKSASKFDTTVFNESMTKFIKQHISK